jgi:enoyl-CoA hydratase
LDTYSSYTKLLFELDDNVLIVSLNRPDRLNALDVDLQRELIRFFSQVDDDAAVNTIVLTGVGSAFCGGQDVAPVEPSGEDDPVQIGARVFRLDRRLIYSVLNCEKPIVMAVNGPAIGTGATLALLGDIVVMSRDAVIGETNVKLGLVSGDGAVVLLPLLVGIGRAKEILMTGRLVSGQEAAEIGLVTGAVAAKDVRAEAVAAAKRLAELPPYALRATKVSLNRIIQRAADDLLDTAIEWKQLSARSARQPIDPIDWLRQVI